jgi:hypothetical protein
MNISGILRRVFDRVPKENVVSIISDKKSGWVPDKKHKKKSDLLDEFLKLETLINEDEVEDFIEMAVMTRMKGFPAYTYKIGNLNFLYSSDNTELIQLQDIVNYPFKDIYTVSVERIDEQAETLKVVIRLKEYAEAWRTGLRSPDSISAVYKINISVDKSKKVLTIHSGDYHLQEVIKDFLGFVLKWPLQAYRIRETNQAVDIGSASFKTAIIIDLIFNRLKDHGIFSKFKEIRFNTKNKSHLKDGIRNVTISGRNIVSSQLACEYITLGSDIISFKVEMTYNEIDFTTEFSLKGTDTDIMKIVVTHNVDESFKNEVINIIQEEYIEMCNSGIKDISETKKHLEQIYIKFIRGDKLVNEVIEDNTLKILELLVQATEYLKDQDEIIINIYTEFVNRSQAILDTIGYDGDSGDIKRIKEFIGLNDDNDEELMDD